jgi:hypothetical protein
MAADLNAAGRKDFLVAVYNVYAKLALRVLRTGGGFVALAAEPDKYVMGGIFPKIALIDVDHSGHPAIVVSATQGHGETTRCFLKWDGNSLQPFGTWEKGTSAGDAGWSYSLLNNAYFLDLDGDGILEIVNPPEFEPRHPDGENGSEKPRKYEVYKIGDAGYEPVAFFEGFSQFPGGLPGGPARVQAEDFPASQPGATYVITIANGDGRGVPPVASAEIRLNGELLAGAEKVNRNSRYLTLPVTVKATNRIEVLVTGQEGSALYIGVGPERPALPGGRR